MSLHFLQKSTYTKPAIVRKTREKKEKYVSVYIVVHNRMCLSVTEFCILMDRLMLLEQYNRRTQEASYLVSDFHAGPLTRRHSPVTGGAPMPSTTRHTSAAPSGNIHRYILQLDLVSLKNYALNLHLNELLHVI